VKSHHIFFIIGFLWLDLLEDFVCPLSGRLFGGFLLKNLLNLLFLCDSSVKFLFFRVFIFVWSIWLIAFFWFLILSLLAYFRFHGLRSFLLCLGTRVDECRASYGPLPSSFILWGYCKFFGNGCNLSVPSAVISGLNSLDHHNSRPYKSKRAVLTSQSRGRD